MKHMMAAELSGDLLRVALYELIPQIEDGKRYVVTINQIEREKKLTLQGNDLGGDFGPMTDEEEAIPGDLTYAEYLAGQQKRVPIDLQAINHAHLEPADRSDVAGNEVQPITINMRKLEGQEIMYCDDEEAQP